MKLGVGKRKVGGRQATARGAPVSPEHTTPVAQQPELLGPKQSTDHCQHGGKRGSYRPSLFISHLPPSSCSSIPRFHIPLHSPSWPSSALTIAHCVQLCVQRVQRSSYMPQISPSSHLRSICPPLYKTQTPQSFSRLPFSKGIRESGA